MTQHRLLGNYLREMSICFYASLHMNIYIRFFFTIQMEMNKVLYCNNGTKIVIHTENTILLSDK